MADLLPTVILVLGAIALISFVAQKIAIPAPVMLAVAGMIWSLIPSLPSLKIEPHVILSVFLPPLLYADAWRASWIDFRRWLRPVPAPRLGPPALPVSGVGLGSPLALP